MNLLHGSAPDTESAQRGGTGDCSPEPTLQATAFTRCLVRHLKLEVPFRLWVVFLSARSLLRNVGAAGRGGGSGPSFSCLQPNLLSPASLQAAACVSTSLPRPPLFLGVLSSSPPRPLPLPFLPSCLFLGAVAGTFFLEFLVISLMIPRPTGTPFTFREHL